MISSGLQGSSQNAPEVRAASVSTPGRMRPFLLVAVLFSIVVNLLMLVSPLYMLQVYDRVLTSGSVETLILVSVLAGGLMVTYVFAESARRHVLSLGAVFLRQQMGRKLFNVNFNRTSPEGALRKDLSDMGVVQSFYSNGLALPFFDLPFTPFFMMIMFLVHPLIGWIGVAGAVLLFLIAILAELSTRGREQFAQDAERTAQNFAADVAEQRSAIVSMGMAQSAFEDWQRRKVMADTLSLGTSKATNFFGAFTRGTRLVLQMAALGTGGWLVLQQQATPGVIIAASILLGRALAPIDQCVGMWRQIIRTRKSWRELKARLNDPDATPDPFTPMPRPDAKLEFVGLQVAIPGAEQPILPRFNLSLAGGTMLAIAGPSGTGKTSLLQTLTGVWSPQEGQVTLGGRDLHTWNIEDRGRFLGYLPQNVDLLPGSVVENIARFTGAEGTDAVQVAKDCGVHELISGLSDGYDTKVGLGGMHVSAGQAQAVGLARALFGDPVLIVLDEPSSNLDSFTVARLKKSLAEKRAAGRIVIVATHDVRLIKEADQVLVLSKQEIKLVAGEAYYAAVTGRDVMDQKGVSA